MQGEGKNSSRGAGYQNSNKIQLPIPAPGLVAAVSVSPRRHYLVVAIGFSRGRRGDRLALVYVLGPVKGRIAPVVVTSAMAKQVVWVAEVNECDIVSGRWPTVGHVSDFNLRSWPIPPFFLVDDEVEYYRKVLLTSTLEYKAIRRVSKHEVEGDRESCAFGAGAFRTELTRRHKRQSFPEYPDLMRMLGEGRLS